MRRPQLRRRAQRLHGAPVREQRVVRGEQELREAQLVAGRVPALDEAGAQEHLRLVERHPVLHAIAEALRDQRRVVGEPAADVAVQPAAAVVERQRQIPVIKRHPRRDARGEERVDQAIVEIEPLRVRRAGALRDHARPRHAQAVRLDAERLHDRDVFLPAVVVVAGDVAALVLPDRARLLAEHVPDRRALAVGGRRALDLIRRRGGAPDEALRELGQARRRFGAARSSHRDG